MSTILLLFFSNIFMTFAWYGHLKIRSRLAAVEGDPDLVGDRARRILPGGAGQSLRLRRVLGVPAQDHSRGGHAHRLHRIRDGVSEGEARVELSPGIRLSRNGGV